MGTGDASSRFEIFWKLYPARNGRKLGKGAAYQRFILLNEADQLLCCRAAGVYSQFYKRPLNGREFRPEPRDAERFLKKDWWRDWLEPESKPCSFRSLSQPCDELAQPNDRVCKQHRDYLDRMEAFRKRNMA